MPNTLRSAIADLAATFAAAVTTAIRSSNLEDILELSGAEDAPTPVRRGPGRPPKAHGGTGTGNPDGDAGGGGRTGRAAGGGGQPDPLAVPVEGTAGAPAKKAAASARKERPAKKTAATVTRAATAKRAAKPGRLPRRSPAEIAKALAKVVALVKSDAGGLRAEQIRERLGMASKEMPRVLKEGIAKKVLKSKGAKRSTTYTAA
jgi:hypothetical protein